MCVTSPIVAPPLHRLDCCVITDGGGALVLAGPEVARSLARPLVAVLGCGETIWTRDGGAVELTRTGASRSGPEAFEAAGVSAAATSSMRRSTTTSPSWWCSRSKTSASVAKGQGGRFVADGNLISGVGRLPFNTDGGGLCNNHPGNRGGMTKLIEAVRQLRGEAHPAVQVPGCELALASGPARRGRRRPRARNRRAGPPMTITSDADGFESDPLVLPHPHGHTFWQGHRGRCVPFAALSAPAAARTGILAPSALSATPRTIEWEVKRRVLAR